jgi:molybdate transport system permease protein
VTQPEALPVTSPDERHPKPRPRRRLLIQLLSLPLLAFLSLPLLALIAQISPARLVASLQAPQVLQAIGLSLATSLSATLITVILGTPLAYALARNLFRWRRLLDTLVDLPIILPPAVAGVALLVAFGRRGLFGGMLHSLGIDIAFTTAAVILAQIFIASPFYIKSARIGFAAIDWEIEQAAGLDGASPWQVFRFVIVPLAGTALLGGSVMTWARAMGEFGATIIFAGNFPGRTQTMPLAIYLGFELNLDIALTLSAILVGFSFFVLMVVKGILQREVITF